MINKFDLIFFDCDGVIFDSNSLKSEAFAKTLENRGYNANIIKEFVIYHKKNGGISRYKKFRTFITDFLNIEFDQDLYDNFLESYSKYCLELYEEAELTEDLIKLLKSNNSPKYIVSGGDEEELKYIFKKRNIDFFFKEIYGSPKTKNEIICNIQHENKNSILIGDSLEDLLVAKKNNITPIFMKRYSENKDLEYSFCKENNIKVIDTLTDLI